MKLLIATPLYPPEIGGPATYAATLEAELPKHGESVQVLPFSSVRTFPKVIRHTLYLWKVFVALKDADLLLLLDPVSVGLPGVLAALLRRKPIVLKVVGDYAWEQGQQRYGVKEGLDEFVRTPTNRYLAQVGILRSVQEFVARHATHIIVPSQYLKGIVLTWGVNEEKITVVYNAFDGMPELPSKQEARKHLRIDGTIIVSAGRLVPWKGFATLIDVVATIRKDFPATLFIAGEGPMEGDLKRRIVETNSSVAVVLLGSVPREKLMLYIRAADCFVLNTGYEGLSHQLLEVLAVETPIVTTRVGGNPELIDHEITGLLVDYDNKEQLTVAIRRVLLEHEETRVMASRGKHFVALFSTERMISESLNVFHKTLRP